MRNLLLFLSLFVFSCQSQRLPEVAEILHHQWEATKISGTTKMPGFSIPPNMRVQGSDGCNRFMAQAKVDSRVAFEQVAGTKMACAHGVDKVFWTAIDQHDRWRIKKGNLQLLKGRKVLMTFASKPKPEAEADMVGEIEESE